MTTLSFIVFELFPHVFFGCSFVSAPYMRDAVVECLGTHDYDAESPEVREIAPGFRHPSDDWKTLSVSPAVNGYHFQIRKG